jgi:hypothetical protein
MEKIQDRLKCKIYINEKNNKTYIDEVCNWNSYDNSNYVVGIFISKE